MIDLHCHLLPGIDDGSRSLEESLAMARLAVADGITAVRATPHIHIGRYANDRASIEAAAEALRGELAREGISLELTAAAEVRLDYELVAMIEADRIPYLGALDGEPVLLLEFPHSHVPVGAEHFVAWLRRRGIRPMIAHPERNRGIMEDPGRLSAFVDAGCLLQLTADAVAGGFGAKAERAAREMLEREWVTVLASDAHDTKERPPRLSAGRAAASRIVGDEAARRLTEDMPRRLLSGS